MGLLPPEQTAGGPADVAPEVTMRQVTPHLLWIGHSGDRAQPRNLHAAGIGAIVDVAIDEAPASVSRELVYCRFPLTDGSANHRWMLRTAVECVASFLRSRTPVLVCCSGGMSRSPCIAAAALSLVTGETAEQTLRTVLAGGPCDLSGGLWEVVQASIAQGRQARDEG